MKIATLADWFGVGAIEGIRESEHCGAQGVQLYAADELDPRTLTDVKLSLLKRTLSECGQTVTALCGELGGYGLERAGDNPGKIAYLKAVMDLAVQLDCHVVTTHIGVVPATDDHPRYAVMRDAMREIGSPKVLNLILLGAAVRGGALGLDEADLEAAVRSRIPQKFHELNLRALAWAK